MVKKERIFTVDKSDNIKSSSKMKLSDITFYLHEFQKTGDVQYLDQINMLLNEIRIIEKDEV